MQQNINKKTYLRSWVCGLVAIVLLVWVIYKIANSRVIPSLMSVDTSCQTDPNTVADMSQFTPNAKPIYCQSWDIGTGVTGYVWEAPNPRAVLLLQHGYGDYSQSFVKQNNQLIPHLLNMGISVYAIDMWGNGRSQGSRGATNVNQAVKDHLAARQKLREQPLPVFLLGASLGGLVTATSTVRDQSDLNGVILLSPAIKYDVSASDLFIAQVGGFIIPTIQGPIPPNELTVLTHDPKAIEQMSNDPLRYNQATTWITLSSGATIAPKNWELYKEIQVPVLAIHGTADMVADPNGSRQFIDVVASSDKTLHLVEGGLHSLLDDTDRDTTLQTILTWLENHLPPN